MECGTPGYLVCWDPLKNFFSVILWFVLRASYLLRQVLYHLSPSTSSFGVRYFEDMVLPTVRTSWLRTAILLISNSKLARFTDGNPSAPPFQMLPVFQVNRSSWDLFCRIT
jgi:hypothetical protein